MNLIILILSHPNPLSTAVLFIPQSFPRGLFKSTAAKFRLKSAPHNKPRHLSLIPPHPLFVHGDVGDAPNRPGLTHAPNSPGGSSASVELVVTMAARPLVTVYNEKNEPTGTQVKLPAVFTAPIRPDLVSFIHDQLRKNKRQPYAVSTKAGHQTSAESWGTGRAVARIPRVRGGGTHRSGQGAFGNMCRGGRMFAPTKTYRRWHRRVNVAQRRYAAASAIAASGVPALVQARGHVIDKLNEIPLVINDKVEGFKKTKEAVALLKQTNLWADVEKAANSKRYRAGKGKGRNRRYKQKKGPLVIYNNDGGLVQAFRNIPGVSTLSVDRLNLLKLAPGGHLGRLILWTEGAFKKLDSLFGTLSKASEVKKNFSFPRAKLTNADISRIVRSEEILKAVVPKRQTAIVSKNHGNPLKQAALLNKLNPYAAVIKRASRVASKA
uniref:Ribos_L4_asso_C domain-containing protein n=1 Tax=Panagrellus redivivus TaxID=6233 RepID=A0A7E4VUL7_PANRE